MTCRRISRRPPHDLCKNVRDVNDIYRDAASCVWFNCRDKPSSSDRVINSSRYRSGRCTAVHLHDPPPHLPESPLTDLIGLTSGDARVDPDVHEKLTRTLHKHPENSFSPDGETLESRPLPLQDAPQLLTHLCVCT